jgi:hypothetical protein
MNVGAVQLFFSFLHAGSLDEDVDAPASQHIPPKFDQVWLHPPKKGLNDILGFWIRMNKSYLLGLVTIYGKIFQCICIMKCL